MALNYVVDLRHLDPTNIADVGGKAAHLAELARIEGVDVPGGCCVRTAAFTRVVAQAPAAAGLLDRLSRLTVDEGDAIRSVSAELRATIERLPLPDDLMAEIGAAVTRFGEGTAWAVRSSATAEDLPTASFAGQQDSYLNVVGAPAVLDHISRCWASLFTERSVIYRLRHGFDHRAVRMAVVVQQLVVADAAGVLFTADPVTSNRTTVTVEAVPGLGEALVAGETNADVWTVRDDTIVARAIGRKRSAVRVSTDAGTATQPIAPQRQEQPTLTDAQVVRLARLGRRIEAHFGRPQDIEWCLVDDDVRIVQSRSITTLFPIPDSGDGENHVYLSVGHQQMMTDAMKPLGLSVWHLTTSAVMNEAGGRLFVDVTRRLASPAGRDAFLDLVGTGDPLTGDALRTVLERGFVPPRPDAAVPDPRFGSPREPIDADPAIVTELVERSEASLVALQRDVATRSGPALFDFMLTAFEEDKQLLFDPRSLPVIMAAMDAGRWLNDHLHEWLGEQNAADTLTLSVPHNVTSEMGLALLDVADVIRPHPEVVAFLTRVEGEARTEDGFLAELTELDGGAEAQQAIGAYLDRYGMRCAGEIDITRPRWTEQPAGLVPTILGNVRNFAPGAAVQRFEQGLEQAHRKERDVLARLRALPDGAAKAHEAQQMIARVRTFSGYREYPKYNRVRRAFVYRQALLHEAERLVRDGVLPAREDIYFLRFDELHETVRTGSVDHRLIEERKAAFQTFETLSPPRVLTSEGETVTGTYRRDDLPAGAFAGLPVSGGTAEGRARVVTDMAQADLGPGDILVTAFTDPSWTPLFVGITGLVTEVGGLMTHGAVIAREYGLPAVVGVTDATRLIRDGQRIRVHGAHGYVEVLDRPADPDR